MTASGVITWSQTASSNSNADSSINFAEGMAPSAVNDSGRGLMASVAKWRDDLAGTIVTTGTSTAYAVTSNQVESALTAGYVIAFVPHTTNGATVTLDVDGLGAKPLRSAPDTELASGVLIEGTPYTATYYSSNSGEWILHGFYVNPYSVPLGVPMAYVGTTAPSNNFALAYGQAVSRTTYASLFALTSTTFGTGDGSTTFNLPDLRGRTIFGLDNMGGTAASRITSAGSSIDGTTRGATGGSEKHKLTITEMPAHAHNASTGSAGSHNHTLSYDSSFHFAEGATPAVQHLGASGFSSTVSTSSDGVHSHSIDSQGGDGYHPIMPPAMILPYIIRVL